MSCGDCFHCINKDDSNEVTLEIDNNVQKKDEGNALQTLNDALNTIKNAIDDEKNANNTAEAITEKVVEIIDSNKAQQKQIDEFKDEINNILKQAKNNGTINNDEVKEIDQNGALSDIIQAVNKNLTTIIKQLSNTIKKRNELENKVNKKKQELKTAQDDNNKLNDEIKKKTIKLIFLLKSI